VPLSGKRALVVDDNETNRKVLVQMLQSWGLSVTTAASGPDGLTWLRQARAGNQPFDLVLIDGVMPEMDGFQMAQKARADGLAGPAVMMLSSSGEGAERCWELGIHAYLTKPVTQSDLLEAIGMALGLAATDEEATRPPEPPAHAKPPRPLRILLAEDNEVNRQVAIGMLARDGHHVVSAVNGRSAVALWEKERFDLILMDVQMPEMDGFQATAEIRVQEVLEGKSRHIPIVALTAYAMPGDRERCLAAGMDEHLAKPLQSPVLSYTIAKVFGWAQAAPVSQVGHHREEMLQRYRGDRALIADLATLFLRDAPRMMSEIEQGV
jgi:CheY-like chemotaxis protein